MATRADMGQGAETDAAGRGGAGQGPAHSAVRMEVYGEEIVERQVHHTNQVGRVYLPLDWVGKRIKIIRMG
ncbi:MAG: DUF2080 family transposase-associated protein [Pseudomonadota bacterium]